MKNLINTLLMACALCACTHSKVVSDPVQIGVVPNVPEICPHYDVDIIFESPSELPIDATIDKLTLSSELVFP